MNSDSSGREMKRSYFYIALIIIGGFFSCKEKLTCKNFRSGKFIYNAKINNDQYIIDRSDSFQIERDLKTGLITKAKIKWISDCEFEMHYVSSEDTALEKFSSMLGNIPVMNRILKIGEDYYIFEQEIEGAKMRITDTMWIK